ncbi:hypothetical protein NPIL_530841 [Nephila pilipes]|uniref:Uncharacterized protein n=1 Tax=Nephila pilipes TaxID=299642 RepID=A0A8X6NTR9_NEPPI|nr:hypothetical protein NPIL_530841 [Nephila pilipes]
MTTTYVVTFTKSIDTEARLRRYEPLLAKAENLWLAGHVSELRSDIQVYYFQPLGCGTKQCKRISFVHNSRERSTLVALPSAFSEDEEQLGYSHGILGYFIVRNMLITCLAEK